MDEWETALLLMESQIVNFPGDKAVVEDILKQNNDLSKLLGVLRDELPKTTLQQITEAVNKIQDLSQNFKNVLATQGNESKSSQT